VSRPKLGLRWMRLGECLLCIVLRTQHFDVRICSADTRAARQRISTKAQGEERWCFNSWLGVPSDRLGDFPAVRFLGSLSFGSQTNGNRRKLMAEFVGNDDAPSIALTLFQGSRYCFGLA
jgi:hypothetical protein